MAIYAAGLKTGEILAGLAAAAGVRGISDDSEAATGVRELLKALHVRERPLVALIDALDEVGEVKTSNEVAGLPQVVEQLLLPLIHGGEGKIRLLLAARPTLCEQLGRDRPDGYLVVDLDSRPYEDPDSVATVVRTILQASPSPAGGAETAGPVFRNASAVLLHDVTGVIADTAGHSFLVAKILAATEGAKEELPDPGDRQWRAELPREAGPALRRDLVLRLGDEAERATDLLRPLAYARGDGLPWEDIWLRLANTLSPGHGYTTDDLLWVSGHAGSFVKQVDPADEEENESAGAGRRYRLSHRALAEGLQEGRDVVSDEHAIVVALQQQAPQLGGGRADWANAHRYTLRHLADHAAASGDIDRLAQDPGFLLAADRPQLLAALDHTRTAQGRAAADAYRSALPALRRPAVEEHAAYLGLAARQGRAAALADRLRADSPGGPWSAQWAAWHAQRPHLTITGHACPVGAVVVARCGDALVVVSADDDGLVLVHDLATGDLIGQLFVSDTRLRVRALAVAQQDGRQIILAARDDGTVLKSELMTDERFGSPIRGHAGRVNALAVTELDGAPAVISAGDDATVLVSDLNSGEQLGPPIRGHAGRANALAVTELDGAPAVISAGDDATVRIWDLDSGALVGRVYNAHSGSVRAITTAESQGRRVVVSAGADRRIHVWDQALGRQIGEPFTGHADWVRALATADLDGRSVVISAGDDATVRIWDLATGDRVGEPFTGHANWVRALATADLDGRSVVISAGDDATVRVWDLASGETGDPFSGHSRAVRALAIADRDDHTIVISASADRNVQVWDLATGRSIGKPFSGHTTGPVTAVAAGWLAGRPVAVSGGADSRVLVWNPRNGDLVGEPFTRHTGPVTAVTLSRRGGRSVVISEELTPRLWCGTWKPAPPSATRSPATPAW